MNRVYRDGWIWCFLALGLLTLFFAVIAADQTTRIVQRIGTIEAQNRTSIRDRGNLRETQDQIRRTLERIEKFH